MRGCNSYSDLQTHHKGQKWCKKFNALTTKGLKLVSKTLGKHAWLLAEGQLQGTVQQQLTSYKLWFHLPSPFILVTLSPCIHTANHLQDRCKKHKVCPPPSRPPSPEIQAVHVSRFAKPLWRCMQDLRSYRWRGGCAGKSLFYRVDMWKKGCKGKRGDSR